MNKVSSMALLLGSSQAVTAGLKNTNWPRYEVVSYGSSLPSAAVANGYATTTTGLYRCMRDGLVAILPQKINVPAIST